MSIGIKSACPECWEDPCECGFTSRPYIPIDKEKIQIELDELKSKHQRFKQDALKLIKSLKQCIEVNVQEKTSTDYLRIKLADDFLFDNEEQE